MNREIAPEIKLRAENLKKTFFNPKETSILKGVDLAVQGGESVAIMGRSGEGKSTLLHILGTLEKATSGDLVIAGQKVNSFNINKIRRKHLAFVFQSYHLLDDYSVMDNILMPARINRQSAKPGTPAYARAEELLEMVQLSHRKDFNTKLLSGGEKQRVAIARALFNDPDIILADEPSGNLDRTTADMIHDLLISFARQHSKALIIVTHDDRLANLCDTRYTLTSGNLVRR